MIIFFVVLAILAGCVSLAVFIGSFGLIKALLLAALVSSGLILCLGLYVFFCMPQRKEPEERAADNGDENQISLRHQ